MHIQEIERTPAATDDWQSNERHKTIPAGLEMIPGNDQYGYVFQTLKGRGRLNLTSTDLSIKFYDMLYARWTGQ